MGEDTGSNIASRFHLGMGSQINDGIVVEQAITQQAVGRVIGFRIDCCCNKSIFPQSDSCTRLGFQANYGVIIIGFLDCPNGGLFPAQQAAPLVLDF